MTDKPNGATRTRLDDAIDETARHMVDQPAPASLRVRVMARLAENGEREPEPTRSSARRVWKGAIGAATVAMVALAWVTLRETSSPPAELVAERVPVALVPAEPGDPPVPPRLAAPPTAETTPPAPPPREGSPEEDVTTVPSEPVRPELAELWYETVTGAEPIVVALLARPAALELAAINPPEEIELPEIRMARAAIAFENPPLPFQPLAIAPLEIRN